MAYLITVPTFTFNQIGDENLEQPIQVSFYNGTIELSQNDDSINILPEKVKELFKEILKHQKEAESILKN